MMRISSAFIRPGRSLAQRRCATAAAFPADPPPAEEVARGSASLNAQQRHRYPLGPSNERQHGFQYNTYDPEDAAFPDPVTGWKPDVKASVYGAGATGNELSAYEPKPSAKADLSSIQEAVEALKANPPLSVHDPNGRERYRTGAGNTFLNGTLDPCLRLYDAKTRRFLNPHLGHVNETADGLVQCASDGARVVGGVLHQPMRDSSKKLRRLQVPYTQRREEQGFKDMPLIKDAGLIDPVQPGRLETEITQHFGTVGTQFVVDGAASSSKDDEVRVRVYTDNAAHALFWTHLLHKIPGRDFWQTNTFRPPVVLYHAPGFTFEEDRIIEEFGGPKPKDLGLEHERYLLVDPYSKPATAIVSGELSLDIARDVVAYLVGIVAFEELDVLTLPGDAVLSADGQSATVYIGGSPKLRALPQLYGAHHLSLSPDGLGRVWDAVTKPLGSPAPVAGDLVTEEKEKLHTAPLSRRLGDASSRPKARSLHWDSVNRRYVPVRYDSVADDAGLLLGQAKPKTSVHRPNLIPSDKVEVVFPGSGNITKEQAAEKYAKAVQDWGYPFAPAAELSSAFLQAIDRGVKVSQKAFS